MGNMEGNGKKKNRRLAMAAAILAVTLCACGSDGGNAGYGGSEESASERYRASVEKKDTESASSTHAYTYRNTAGTYTGNWENDRPNGEGKFLSESAGERIEIVGSWLDGNPHGQCKTIYESKERGRICTYTGDFLDGVWNGDGDYKEEDRNGNLISTYSGEFRDGAFSGSGEYVYYFIGEEAVGNDCSYLMYKGQFSNGTITGSGTRTIFYNEDVMAEKGYYCDELEGEFVGNKADGSGEWTLYYTEEKAAETGWEQQKIKGQFVDNQLADGEGEWTIYCTEAETERTGFDCWVRTGEMRNGAFVEPYRYAFYKDGSVVEEGRIRDGKIITDQQKAENDAIYDILRGIAGYYGYEDAYDLIAPGFYDRNAE